MTPTAQALAAGTGVALLGLLGLALRAWSARAQAHAASFAAGILLGTAFLDLLPAALAASAAHAHGHAEGGVFAAALAMIVLLFMLDRGVHAPDGHATTARRVLAGDGLHNLFDGMAIGAGFLAGPELGLAATLAVAAHEIPHQVADYGWLTGQGVRPAAAAGLSTLAGLATVVGAGVVTTLGAAHRDATAWLLTGSAGVFIYVAASQLIPRLHRTRPPAWQHAALCVGGAVLPLVLLAARG